MTVCYRTCYLVTHFENDFETHFENDLGTHAENSYANSFDSYDKNFDQNSSSPNCVQNNGYSFYLEGVFQMFNEHFQNNIYDNLGRFFELFSNSNDQVNQNLIIANQMLLPTANIENLETKFLIWFYWRLGLKI